MCAVLCPCILSSEKLLVTFKGHWGLNRIDCQMFSTMLHYTTSKMSLSQKNLREIKPFKSCCHTLFCCCYSLEGGVNPKGQNLRSSTPKPDTMGNYKPLCLNNQLVSVKKKSLPRRITFSTFSTTSLKLNFFPVNWFMKYTYLKQLLLE